MTLPLPHCSLAARSLKDPLADRDDQPARFEGGNEVVGLHDAPCGMTPAQEGLHAGEDTGGEVDGGLVEQEELISGKGTVEINVETAVIIDRFQHRRREDGETVLPGCFGAVERDVGIAQQLFGRGPVAGGDTDAGGDRQGDIAAGDLEGRFQGAQ